MNKVILKIGGMSCSACSTHIEKYLNKQEGIRNAVVNLVMAQAMVEYDDSLKVEDIERFINESGYESLGVYDEKEELKENKHSKNLLIVLGILAILLMYISMSHMIGLPVIPFLHMINHPVRYAVSLFILTIPFLVYGFDILKNGFKNLKNKAPNMDSLVMLGVTVSFLYSTFGMIMVILGFHENVENLYFESVAIILLFIKIGRYIDSKSKEKTKAAIQELVQITPKTAVIKIDDMEKEVTIDEVKKGDILVCRPGMKIAVDGMITHGEGHFDEAFITGESIPKKKKKEDSVVAGSINLDGYIEYEAVKIGRDSTISEIVRLVVEATNTKAPIARLADKVSTYFVPSILIIAFITFISYFLIGHSFQEAILSFVTVLVVACPCALGLATPLAIVVSMGRSAHEGILIKTSSILENASKIDTIVFDKTGTLTYGNLKVANIYNFSKHTDYELLGIVASIESKSKHPISKAFLDYTAIRKIKLQPVENFINISGIGLSAIVNGRDYYVGNHKLFKELNIKNDYEEIEEKLSSLGNSIVYVIEDDVVVGLIGVNDIVREEAKDTITKLYSMNKEIMMLTGDNEKTAKMVADSIGIKTVKADVLPKEKTAIIKKLLDNGKNVMMVGDGINDAPSLATATIGVSVNSGTDIAADSSDVILMNDNLERIVSFISISKKTLRIIKENLFWAFFYNILMIPLAIGVLKPIGISMNPMIAGFFMTISSLTVVLNSLRLRGKTRR